MKNFDNWNIKKKILDEKKAPNPKTRDIWWAYTGINIGNEQNGGNKSFQRPVLILKKFNNKIFLALPLTTKEKNDKFHFKTIYKEQPSFIILSQIKLMSSKRLRRKIRRLDRKEVDIIYQKLKEIIF